jgi:hypothetical protein
MRTNTTSHSEKPLRGEPGSAAIPDIEILRPDGSWKPITACVAMPEQFEGTLPGAVIEGFIDSARRSNLALDRVIAAIRQNWNS